MVRDPPGCIGDQDKDPLHSRPGLPDFDLRTPPSLFRACPGISAQDHLPVGTRRCRPWAQPQPPSQPLGLSRHRPLRSPQPPLSSHLTLPSLPWSARRLSSPILQKQTLSPGPITQRQSHTCPGAGCVASESLPEFISPPTPRSYDGPCVSAIRGCRVVPESEAGLGVSCEGPTWRIFWGQEPPWPSCAQSLMRGRVPSCLRILGSQTM